MNGGLAVVEGNLEAMIKLQGFFVFWMIRLDNTSG
jgi:hypothetical protein